MKKYKVGYVDENEGQQLLFYHAFSSDFEVKTFEIPENLDPDELVEDIFQAKLDVLVLDFTLNDSGLVDFNSDTLIDKILSQNLHYPLVILTSNEIDALHHIDNANLVNGKDEMLNDKKHIFKEKLIKIASTYESDVAEALETLGVLEAKRKTEGLDPDEEDDYVRVNNFLGETTDADSHISRTFFSEDTNKMLDEVIKIAEELLKKPQND